MQLDSLIPFLIGGLLIYIISKNIIVGRIKEESPIQVMNHVYVPSYLLIDVREQEEFFSGHIPKSVNIPLSRFNSLFKEIPTDKSLIIICRTGKRGRKAISLLKDNGYNDLVNLKGGIVAWQKSSYPLEYGK